MPQAILDRSAHHAHFLAARLKDRPHCPISQEYAAPAHECQYVSTKGKPFWIISNFVDELLLSVLMTNMALKWSQHW